MVIGLKSGTVALADHDPEWETIAAQTIDQLWRVFGSAAKDIQHVGSTAIRHIKAKPIIDIAVAVDDFSSVEELSAAVEKAGFLRRHWETAEQMLFAAGDYSRPDGVVTHFIHVVKTDSMDWHNYLRFRDYLNANVTAAKSYEDLKVRLADENPLDKRREKYLAGKRDFIQKTLQDALMWACLHDIPGYDSFVKIEPVTKGWSGDKKYYIETTHGKRLLLRVAEIAQYDRKKTEFEMMGKVAALGVPMQQPIDFGTCNGGKSVYVLLTWVDGEDAEKILPLLSETQQYVLGLSSGKILRKIHSLSAPGTLEDWQVRFNRKTDRRIETYHKNKTQALTSGGEEHFLSYVENNRALLKNRPQCYQHGDYHPGNMIIAPNGSLFIIDWNRDDFGDPWEEFNRITFTAHTSPHFTTGQLQGYFDGEPPEEFFKLLAFYIASNQLGVVGWALPFGKSEVDFAQKQNEEVLDWYSNMRTYIPSWYLKDFYIQWIDGIPFKLKAPFDFSFLSKYGKVFKVYDDQDSGNICFGITAGDKRYFVKFAGAPTERAGACAKTAITNLKKTVSVYQDLAHPNLVRLIDAEEIGGGFAMIFEWADAECMHQMYPLSRRKFMQMDLETRYQVFKDIIEFHAHVVRQGYIAIDFYDGSIMYDFGNKKTIICDIDFYTKAPYINKRGRLWGSSRFMSPEEYQPGATIDEITNVYVMGATAFALFGDERDRCIEKWQSDQKLFDVAKRAVSDERDNRQQSIEQFMEEWRAASCTLPAIPMRTIIVEPYNPKWAKEFEKIKSEILPLISDNIISFEHVGSTAVVGLWAKPVIDIDIIVDDGMVPIIIKKLAAIGYVHEGDLGIIGREAFSYKDEDKANLMKHHLYVCHKDNAELKQHLAFRDFLRKNPEYCEKYSKIKIEMAKKYPHDIDSYIKGKEPVVMEIYKLCGIKPWQEQRNELSKYAGQERLSILWRG